NAAGGQRFGVGINGPLADTSGVIRTGNGSGVGAAGKASAFLVFRLHAGKNRAVIFPGGDVEEPSARAVGWRVPVRSALDAGIRRHTRRLRCGDWPAIGIEAARPIDLHEWLAVQKLARTTIQNIKEAIAIAPEHQL